MWTGLSITAGEKQGKSLLARDAPSVWYEAAAVLTPLPAPAVQAAAANTLSEADFEAKKQAAIAALQNEEAVFEKDLGMSLPTALALQPSPEAGGQIWPKWLGGGFLWVFDAHFVTFTP